MTLFEFAVPLIALAASGVALVLMHRKPEPVRVRVQAERRHR